MQFNFGDSPFRHPASDYSAVSKATNLVPFSASTAAASGRPGKNTSSSSQQLPMALILEPARELAQQTHDNITLFKKHLPSPGLK
jgi:ATP-dependent RNA helicase DDX1